MLVEEAKDYKLDLFLASTSFLNSPNCLSVYCLNPSRYFPTAKSASVLYEYSSPSSCSVSVCEREVKSERGGVEVEEVEDGDDMLGGRGKVWFGRDVKKVETGLRMNKKKADEV